MRGALPGRSAWLGSARGLVRWFGGGVIGFGSGGGRTRGTPAALLTEALPAGVLPAVKLDTRQLVDHARQDDTYDQPHEAGEVARDVQSDATTEYVPDRCGRTLTP